MKYTIMQLDRMEGHDFEYAVADLLFHNGWRDVKVTQGSGDYGVDVLARRKNVKYGIQCKRYEGNVGVKAVQEAISGTEFYHCDVAGVVTNSTYTKQAENLAKTSGVRLFGRDFLEELIENYDEEYDILDPTNAALFIRNNYELSNYEVNKNVVSKDDRKRGNTTKQSQKKKVKQEEKTGGCLCYLVISGLLIYIFAQLIQFFNNIL